MNGIRLAIEDIKHLWRTNIGTTALGLMILPLVYSYIYLWAFWDPTSYLYKLPLAVVNNDAGINQVNMQINIGNDLVDKLILDKSMNWNLVSQEQADQGLEGGKYFLVLTIPEDFTEKAYSVGSANPQPAQLVYKINEGANMLGAKVTRSIMSELEKQLKQRLFTEYLRGIFEQILSGARGLTRAADASEKLAAGTNETFQGTKALTDGLQESGAGMNQLAVGLTKLQTGARQLALGAAELNAAISSGVAKAEQYIEPLQAVLAVLSDLARLTGDINNAISDAVSVLENNKRELAEIIPGINDAEQRLDSLRRGLFSQLADELRQQNDDLRAASEAIEGIVSEHPELKNDERINRSLKAIERAAEHRQRIEQDRANLDNSMSELKEVFHNINTNIGQKQPQAEQNIKSIISRLQALNLNEAANRLNNAKERVAALPAVLEKLVTGTQQLKTGSEQLAIGLDTFTEGFQKLQEGNKRLTDGALKLQAGLGQIDKGQHELAFELRKAATAAQQDNKTDERIQVISNPVNVEEVNPHPVVANGVGFAPYFIALSLWVGSLVLFFAIELKEVAAMPKRPISYMVNKYFALASVSVFQAVILVFILSTGLGLTTVTNHVQLFTFSIIIGLTYTAILFMLLYILGSDAGRFVAVLLLMLQLTTSGGSYPVQLEPGFFTFLQPFLPMTYAVEGLKNIISIGDQTTIFKDVTALLFYGIGSLVGLYLVKGRSFLAEISERN